MSEIKVNKISPVSDSGTITLGDSGDTFTVPSGATIVNSGTATGFGGGGKIGQVRSTTKTDTWTEAGIASGSFSSIVTGLTVDITPSATSSKILIIVNGVMDGGSGTHGMGFSLWRDSTQIDLGDASSSNPRMSKGKINTVSTGYPEYMSTNFRDEPNSTSQITYGVKTQCSSSSSKTHYVNRSYDDTSNAYSSGRSTSTITAMEILA